MKHTSLRSMLFILLVAMFTLNGCGSAQSSSNQSASSGSGQGAETLADKGSSSGSTAPDSEYPKTVVHAKGRTVIPKKPVKMVTTSFVGADHMFELGLAPYATGALEHMKGQKDISCFGGCDRRNRCCPKICGAL
ncbi:hypothetical protein [Paenibacillus apiarius]|uniref:hypothetical protein n=1 Tax=Paenibacillus apiarius TaxID=46240 RepID=UPI00197F15D5|nr:hypothetical protein [Paenibacillus apiarius]MBN3526546.1 hypothetical protein [Paenibacillus apiarius]